MEEKLAKLILIAKEFSEISKKYYAEIKYDSYFNKVEINIRIKKSHEYVEERAINLKTVEINKIDETINFIKNYEGKEE